MGKSKKTSQAKSKYAGEVEGNSLDLSVSGLEEAPVHDLKLLPLVTTVDLSTNKLRFLPATFCDLTHLVRLDLSRNSITELPANFGDLEDLRHLDLFGNQLRQLPMSFADLTNLRWLDVKNNPWDQVFLPPDVVGKSESDTNDKENKAAAKRVLSHLAQMAEKRRKAADKKRRKKEREAQEKRDEEHRKILEEKRLKAEAKAKRKAEFETKQAEVDPETRRKLKEAEIKAAYDQPPEEDSLLGQYGVTLILGFLILGLAIIAAFFADDFGFLFKQLGLF